MPCHSPGSDAWKIITPAIREDAEKAASLLLTYNSMEKGLASRLKEWVKDNGLMRVGDMVYGPTPSITYELNARAITSQLLEAGVQKEAIWKMLTLTKTSLLKDLNILKHIELLD